MELRSQSLQQLELQQATISKLCLDKATLSFLRVDSTGRIIYANPYACKMFGYSLIEFRMKSVFDFDSAITKGNWSNKWDEVCEQSFVTFENKYIRKDGSSFPVEVNVYLFEVDGQKTIGAFVRDITTRKKVETEALLTHFIFEKVSIAIIHGDEDAKILKVNEFACNLYGYTKEELCNLTIYDIDPSASQQKIMRLWNDMHVKSSNIFETKHKRKDGTIFPVEITSNSLVYEGKQYAVSFVVDITAKKQAEIQKKRAMAQLYKAQKLEALGMLAGGIAHDFNNILSGILGYAELASLHLKPDDGSQKYFKPILNAGNRAKRLIQRILAFTRQGDSKKVPIDISRVMIESLDLIRATIPTSIEIKTNIQSNLGTVLADETMIHQVIMNLCTNAYQAMEKNGGILEVLLASSKIGKEDSLNFPELNPGKYIKLVVADNGHGMDEVTCADIFHPYFTTKESGEGTGLGLSTVHGIVKDHGGIIKVYSEVNVGTSFQVFFPVDGTKEQLPEMNDEILPHGCERILMVDDEDLLLRIGKELLEGLGYKVETCDSSIDALECVRRHPEKYDLIYCDFSMPHMNGDVFTQKAKELRHDLPVIIATGYTTKINRDKLKEVGVSNVLIKPVTLYEMANTVRTTLVEAALKKCPIGMAENLL